MSRQMRKHVVRTPAYRWNSLKEVVPPFFLQTSRNGQDLDPASLQLGKRPIVTSPLSFRQSPPNVIIILEFSLSQTPQVQGYVIVPRSSWMARLSIYQIPRILINRSYNHQGSGLDLEPYPQCSIRPEDCPDLWSIFRAAFANWSAPITIPIDPLEKSCVADLEVSCVVDPMKKVVNVSIDGWLAERGYMGSNGFLGSCPEPEAACIDEVIRSQSERLSKYATGDIVSMAESYSIFLKGSRDCTVRVGQFRLIHFPQQAARSRDLCASDMFGELQTTLPVNEDYPVIATLDAITFFACVGDPRSCSMVPGTCRCAFRLPMLLYFSKLISLEYPQDYIMTPTDHRPWTFTSPSVYLAYDHLRLNGFCRHQSSIIHGIITLEPGELSSVVWSSWMPHHEGGLESYRPFNLEDLNGAVPARAYFKGELCETANPNHNGCTITHDAYFPRVVLPEKIKSLHPSFSNCWPFVGEDDPITNESFPKQWHKYAVSDPPIVLTPTQMVRSPVVIAASTTADYQPNHIKTLPRVGGTSLLPSRTVEIPANTGPVCFADDTGNCLVLRPASLQTTLVVGKLTLTVGTIQTAAVIGSQTLQLVGVPLRIGGLDMSYGTNGAIYADRIPVAQLSVQTGHLLASALSSLPSTDHQQDTTKWKHGPYSKKITSQSPILSSQIPGLSVNSHTVIHTVNKNRKSSSASRISCTLRMMAASLAFAVSMEASILSS
jgi:hypothetical protein